MSQTIRVRDEDAKLIETVSDVTGLNKPEAAHFLFRGETTPDVGQTRRYTELALEAYLIRFYPDIQGPDDVDETLLEETSLNSAEELLSASIDVPYRFGRVDYPSGDDDATEA